MKIIPEHEHKIRRAIRDAYAIDPLMSILTLQGMLEEKFKRKFDWKYLNRLVKKIEGEIKNNIDHARIKKQIKPIREINRMMRERLLKIVYWKPEDARNGMKPPLYSEIVMAAERVVALDIALFKLERDSGLYDEPLEAKTIEFRFQPLPAELADAIVASWKRADILPSAIVEQIAPKSGLPMVIPHA